MLGVSTGGRIRELLSLTIGEVYQNKQPVTDLLFDKSIVKGDEVSRVSVPVNADGRLAIEEIVLWHWEKYQNNDEKLPWLKPSVSQISCTECSFCNAEMKHHFSDKSRLANHKQRYIAL